MSTSNSISASWTSTGRSISTGPGRPERIRWNAFWKTNGTSAGSMTVTAHLVTGPAILAISTAWKSSLSQPGARRLAGDAEDRDRVRLEPNRAR